MIITRESVMDFSESIEQFGNIFKEAGINESEVSIITEASVKEIFGKIKEFFKKIFDKFMEAIKSKAVSIKSGEDTFDTIYNKYKIKLHEIAKKIDKEEIAKEKLENNEFYLYSGFSLADINTNKVHSNFGDYDKDTILSYVTGKNYHAGKWESDEEFLKGLGFQKRQIIKNVIFNLVGRVWEVQSGESYDYEKFDSFSDAKELLTNHCKGEKEFISDRNITSIMYNIDNIDKNKNFLSIFNNLKNSAKNIFDNSIKELNEFEKALLNRSDVSDDSKVKLAINGFSKLVEVQYKTQIQAIDFFIDMRAKQISEYMQIMKFLLSLDKKNNKEEVSESSIFESIEFI